MTSDVRPLSTADTTDDAARPASRRGGRGGPDLRKHVALLCITGVAALLLGGCAAGPNPASGAGADAAGFWLGLWHGFIAPITFVVSLFTDDVSLYEVRNNGGWYDFGFVIGLSLIFSGGGGAAGSRRR